MFHGVESCRSTTEDSKDLGRVADEAFKSLDLAMNGVRCWHRASIPLVAVRAVRMFRDEVDAMKQRMIAVGTTLGVSCSTTVSSLALCLPGLCLSSAFLSISFKILLLRFPSMCARVTKETRSSWVILQRSDMPLVIVAHQANAQCLRSPSIL